MIPLRGHKNFFAALGVKLTMTTPAHAAADGQSERAVGIARQMLRSAVAETGRPWPECIPAVVAAYNNAKSSATGHPPAFVAHLRTTRLMATHNTPPRTLAGLSALADIARAVDADVARNIEDAGAIYADYHDRHRRSAPDLAAGDKVWVRTTALGRNAAARDALRNKRKSLPVWCGPFTVEAKTSTNTYRLTLPSTIAVHPNFNVKNLKAALPGVSGNYRPGPIYITDDGEYYEPERVVSSRKVGGRTQLIVKWVGWPLNRRSWEPLEHFKHLPDMLAAHFGEGKVPDK